MTRRSTIVVATLLFLAHLLDEALTGMHDEAIIVSAYAQLEHLGARHAAYLVFQVTFALGLCATLLAASSERARRALMGLFALALLAEAHHPIRALLTLSWSSGLLTSLPLPIASALILHHLFTTRGPSCSRSSSSRWESAAS